MYDKFFDENGIFVKSGAIYYAHMSVNGRQITLYRFGNDKNYSYFDINGKSVEKALMKSPINGARLSSSFGMRKHPILGYNKMHKGTDFAAPSGTPIMASGAGKITRARWCGGGGNCVKIKHNSTYQTVYAHMKSFAQGMKVGMVDRITIITTHVYICIHTNEIYEMFYVDLMQISFFECFIKPSPVTQRTFKRTFTCRFYMKTNHTFSFSIRS